MASNNVLASSAGDGTGVISGYTVSHQHYTVNTHFYANTPTTGAYNDAVYTGVTFTLTTTATTPNATVVPTNVVAYAKKATGAHPWGHTTTCHTSNWSIVGGHGTGTFHCTFTPVVGANTFFKLGVEANQ